jgi:hypothetical protein
MGLFGSFINLRPLKSLKFRYNSHGSNSSASAIRKRPGPFLLLSGAKFRDEAAAGATYIGKYAE